MKLCALSSSLSRPALAGRRSAAGAFFAYFFFAYDYAGSAANARADKHNRD